jgi:pimeloyl-ACP methyl ester carboxylesterase
MRLYNGEDHPPMRVAPSAELNAEQKEVLEQRSRARSLPVRVVERPSADSSPAERASFTSLVGRRVIDGAGHFLPREKPEAVSPAILELLGTAP